MIYQQEVIKISIFSRINKFLQKLQKKKIGLIELKNSSRTQK